VRRSIKRLIQNPQALDDSSLHELVALAQRFHLIEHARIEAGSVHLILNGLDLSFDLDGGTLFVKELLRGYERMLSSGKHLAWQSR
jgi:hypothetical protein